MRKLAFCLFLGLVLCSLIYPDSNENLQTKLSLLKSENLRIKKSSQIVRQSLVQANQIIESLRKNLQDFKTNSEEREKLLQSSIDLLTAQRDRLEERSGRLTKWIAELQGSNESLERLNRDLKEYQKQAEGQIRLWKIIAISEAVVIAGTLTAFLVFSLSK